MTFSESVFLVRDDSRGLRGNLKYKNRALVYWEEVVQLVENQKIPILKSMIFQNILVPAKAVNQNENYRKFDPKISSNTRN